MNDPNLSMNNFNEHLNVILDKYAPYKKLTKKEYKLKSRPWINNEIQIQMHKRDKLLHKYCKLQDKNSVNAQAIYTEYKRLRNVLTQMKRESKRDYYTKYFEANKNKTSSIWKGIKSLVNINNSSKKDINILDNKGKKITDPQKIADLFNQHYVNVGPNIDKRIPIPVKTFRDYLSKLNVKKTFFLKPVTPHEIFDIILSYDIKKSS